MTVSVTRNDGGTDMYMRFGDAYIKHNDGTASAAVAVGFDEHAVRCGHLGWRHRLLLV